MYHFMLNLHFLFIHRGPLGQPAKLAFSMIWDKRANPDNQYSGPLHPSGLTQSALAPGRAEGGQAKLFQLRLLSL